MADFDTPTGSGFMEGAQREIENEQRQAQAKAIILALSEKCFDKCIGTPGAKLSSGEASCVRNCAQRYFESQAYVAKRFMKMLQAQRSEDL